MQGEQRAEILALCNQVDSLSRQLGDLCRSGQGNSPQAQAVAKYIHNVFICFLVCFVFPCYLLWLSAKDSVTYMHRLRFGLHPADSVDARVVLVLSFFW